MFIRDVISDMFSRFQLLAVISISIFIKFCVYLPNIFSRMAGQKKANHERGEATLRGCRKK